ncbi:GAF domain-containing protein [Aquincola sp. MAHUQ-54]|uniref:GAF domain-containing protein n=1 Tax=Aquincola agrisoli TaxID=3119538 RepID=A0AAW9QBS1_9BURK
MKSSPPTDDILYLGCDLVRLLHQGAGADEFAQRLARVEAAPALPGDRNALVETVRMAMAVRNRMEQLQQRERGMLAVIESTQDLSSRLDLTDLLQAIVSRARRLMSGEVAWLSIYDAERHEFRVVVVDGALANSTQHMVARRQHGVASVVLSTRLPFSTTDYLNDDRFEHDAALDATFRAEGIVSLVGIPLVHDHEVIGLLFVADRYHRTHAAQDIAILGALATHAAVAMRNARDFDRANAALEHAGQSRARVEQHLRSIQAAAEAHEQMTSQLARGASLATLCQLVAQLLDGAVLVMNEAAQEVSAGRCDGYDSPALLGYSPNGAHSAAIGQALRESRRSGRSAVACRIGDETCRVMMVFGGHDVLGAIALFHRGERDEFSVRTFERSAAIVGVVLLSQERIEADKSRSATTLLRSLVSIRQEAAAVLANRAERFGLNLAQPLSLLLLVAETPSAGFVARRLRHLPPLAQTLVDEMDDVVVVLSHGAQAADVRLAVQACLRNELRAVHRGVLSRPVSGVAALPGLYASLRRALPVLEQLGIRGDIVGQNELALYSVLFETHDRASLAEFMHATIGPLLDYDGKRGTDLALTLLSYFDNNQNAKTTAQQLGIHVNTMRQRLITIESLLGHWGVAARALELHVALRLWRITEATA